MSADDLGTAPSKAERATARRRTAAQEARDRELARALSLPAWHGHRRVCSQCAAVNGAGAMALALACWSGGRILAADLEDLRRLERAS